MGDIMARHRPDPETMSVAYRQHYFMGDPPPRLPPPGMEYYIIGVRFVVAPEAWGTVLYGLKPIEGSGGAAGLAFAGM